jgi:hypothetical protein
VSSLPLVYLFLLWIITPATGVLNFSPCSNACIHGRYLQIGIVGTGTVTPNLADTTSTNWVEAGREYSGILPFWPAVDVNIADETVLGNMRPRSQNVGRNETSPTYHCPQSECRSDLGTGFCLGLSLSSFGCWSGPFRLISKCMNPDRTCDAA